MPWTSKVSTCGASPGSSSSETSSPMHLWTRPFLIRSNFSLLILRLVVPSPAICRNFEGADGSFHTPQPFIAMFAAIVHSQFVQSLFYLMNSSRWSCEARAYHSLWRFQASFILVSSNKKVSINFFNIQTSSFLMTVPDSSITYH